MFLKKIIAKHYRLILITIFIAAYLLTRLSYLPYDEINPDGVNWHHRSQQFIVGLKTLDFEKTYQHYHPGVTLMWITGIPVEILKQLTGEQFYNHLNFTPFHIVAKFSLVFAQLIITILLLFFLSKILSFNKALLVISIFSFEPFFVGNSRLYHMDVLLTLFVFLSLTATWIQLHKPSFRYALLVGALISLSFLTKSIGVILLPFLFVVYAIYFVRTKNSIWVKNFILIMLAFGVVTFALFPALWVKPVYYLTEIFSESERVGVRDGHPQIVFGESTLNGGPLFYLLDLVLKSSVFAVAGMVFFVFFQTKKAFQKGTSKWSFSLFTGLFYVSYLVLMTIFSKKIDRYSLVVYPLFGLMCLETLVWVRGFVTNKYSYYFGVIGLYWLTVVSPLITFSPYCFPFTSPLFGSAINANKIIAQKPFGIAIYELKDHLAKNYYPKYGVYPQLGFIDTKPMGAIYPNSKIIDIRIETPSENTLVVLGMNEDFIGDSAFVKANFVKLSSVYVNGLEYWRIYGYE